MNIASNIWNRAVTGLKTRMAEVEEIQKAEGARQAAEMDALVASQEADRAYQAEAAAMRKLELQKSVKEHEAGLDARNQKARGVMINWLNSTNFEVAKKFANYLESITMAEKQSAEG